MSEHSTIPVQVWVDVDIGIADFVRELNLIPGIRTHASCQGTIGEGGSAPYGPQVMVTWQDAAALGRLARYRKTWLSDALAYVHPPSQQEQGK